MTDHAAVANRSSRKWFPNLADDLFVYFVIFAVLMILLIVTSLAARVHLGPFNLAVALTIAGIKALLVVLYFMHVKQASWLTWVFAGAAFVWLLIMIALTMGDYAMRNKVPNVPTWEPSIVSYVPPSGRRPGEVAEGESHKSHESHESHAGPATTVPATHE